MGGGGGSPHGDDSLRPGASSDSLFDGGGVEARQLKRVVRCLPGTRQAATLYTLVLAAQERAQRASGGGWGEPQSTTAAASAAAHSQITGLVPRTASSASLGGAGGMLQSPSLTRPLRRSGSSGGMVEMHAPGGGGRSLFAAEEGEEGFDEGEDEEEGGPAFDLEALAMGDYPGDQYPGGGGSHLLEDGDDHDEDVDAGPVAAAAAALAAARHAGEDAGADLMPAAGADADGAGLDAASNGPPAMPCEGFIRLWCSRGAESAVDGGYRPVSIWRPRPPPGYVSLGDVAQTGYEPPRTPVACYRAADPALAAPLAFQLLWREAGSGATEPVTLWAPLPPPGFAALGCVAVAGEERPARGCVRCVAIARTYASEVFEEATWRDPALPGGMRCSLWQVDNDAATFITVRGHERPDPSAARGALLY